MVTPHTTPSSTTPPIAAPPLATPRDVLGFLVAKARAFDAEVPPSGTQGGSDMIDDRAVAALEDTRDNPAREELLGALGELNTDQLGEVLALVWVGCGDFGADEWSEALKQSAAQDQSRTPRHLLETPLLGDLIESGLDELGYNIAEEEGRD